MMAGKIFKAAQEISAPWREKPESLRCMTRRASTSGT